MLVRERIFVRLYTASRKYLNIYRGKLLCLLYTMRVLHKTFYNFINTVMTRDCYDLKPIWKHMQKFIRYVHKGFLQIFKCFCEPVYLKFRA